MRSLSGLFAQNVLGCSERWGLKLENKALDVLYYKDEAAVLWNANFGKGTWAQLSHLGQGGHAEEVSAEEVQAAGDAVDGGVVHGQVQARAAGVHANDVRAPRREMHRATPDPAERIHDYLAGHPLCNTVTLKLSCAGNIISWEM